MRMLSVLALGPPIARGVLVMSLLFSEIEYAPEEYNGVIIDSERFLLRMNDTNINKN